MNNWRKILPVTVLSLLLAGCGNDFEWFPKYNSGFGNLSTAALPGTVPGTVMREIPFPTGVKAVSDIAYDSNNGSFWLLAVVNGTATSDPDALVEISLNGEFIRSILADGKSWPFGIVNGSNLAVDDTSFWVTSAKSGANASEVYQLARSGLYLNSKFTCPAIIGTPTSTSFCRGLAWDSTTSSYWSAASDSATLANFQLLNGAITSAVTYSNLWTGSGVTDVSFDIASGEIFVIKNGVLRVNASSGAGLGTISFTVPGNGRGDWNSEHFWVVDNSALKLKALFVK